MYYGEVLVLIVYVLGWVNIIGEYIDYNEGFVFLVVINFGMWVVVIKCVDNDIVVIVMDYEN